FCVGGRERGNHQQQHQEKRADAGEATGGERRMAAAAAEGAAAPVAAAMRAVLARAGRAAERSGRAAEAVRVVAIGKTKPVSLLRQLYDAGHRSFGENYVQEFVTKAPQVRPPPPDRIGLDWVAGSPSVCWLIDSVLFSACSFRKTSGGILLGTCRATR
uniref:Uncharacterized protein n=1 Tax=Aegilops tauschii subsp. strangulata TaxID=200361 RepID=A0A453GN40_AEGTS